MPLTIKRAAYEQQRGGEGGIFCLPESAPQAVLVAHKAYSALYDTRTQPCRSTMFGVNYNIYENAVQKLYRSGNTQAGGRGPQGNPGQSALPRHSVRGNTLKSEVSLLPPPLTVLVRMAGRSGRSGRSFCLM